MFQWRIPFSYWQIEVDNKNKRLFISDTGNNRIVITDFNGNYADEIGGKGSGLVDGGFEDCAFNSPQGLAYWYSK